MTLVGGQCNVVVVATWADGVDVGSIEEDVVAWWWSSEAGWIVDFRFEMVGASKIPVRDWERTKVNVVRERRRPVDND